MSLKSYINAYTVNVDIHCQTQTVKLTATSFKTCHLYLVLIDKLKKGFVSSRVCKKNLQRILQALLGRKLLKGKESSKLGRMRR